ncbi:MAG: thioredoxin family protein [Chloroflexi bacterium]|nr:thioredoxin family protein [Chloroflexota bacterium]
MANRPLMDRLENDVGHRLQVLRVNIDDAIGRELANLYNITFTPTFLIFNGRGEKEDEFLYAIDRSRMLYWLNQQTT